jgi:hypothetical protein
MYEMKACYNEAPRSSYTLEHCWRMESKTRQTPFVVASDIEPPKVKIDNTSQSQVSPATREMSYADMLKGSLSGDFVKANANTPVSSVTEGDGPRATRIFYVFHDIEHFLNLKSHFPHCHEIIRCPSRTEFKDGIETKEYKDGLCKGRLLFDFDLKSPLPEFESLIQLKRMRAVQNGDLNFHVDPLSFVHPNFKELVEAGIIHTFKTYYINVDVTKLMFCWQITRHPDKFSMHLIVKNAYFDEYWVKLTRIFYSLFSRVMTNYGYGSLLKSVDLAMARRNATFRILGCSKIDGKPLEIDSFRHNGVDLLSIPVSSNPPKITIYDCLAGIYHFENLKDEQSITFDNVNYPAIEDEVNQLQSQINVEQDLSMPQSKRQNIKSLDRDFIKVMKKNLALVEDTSNQLMIDDKYVNKAVDLFNSFNDGSFVIRDQVQDIINLNRTRASACPLSGVVHDHENAYLKLRPDGYLVFYCRRGCKKYNSYGLTIGLYRTIERPKGVPYIRPEKFEMAKQARTVIIGVDTELPKSMKAQRASNEEKRVRKPKNCKTSARLMSISANEVHIDPVLKGFNPLSKTK